MFQSLIALVPSLRAVSYSLCCEPVSEDDKGVAHPTPQLRSSLSSALICPCPSWSTAVGDGSSGIACHSAETGGR